MLTMHLTKAIKRLLLIMAAATLIIAAYGYVHYRGINRSEDPRVLPARNSFAQYDRLMRENRFTQALALLDDIEGIYQSTSGYAGTFELGVIENNRASIHLVQAETERLNSERLEEALIHKHLEAAHRHALAAIQIYSKWQERHRSLDRTQLEQQVRHQFTADTAAFTGLNPDKIIAKRADDLLAAVEEMPRRLSVAYTNLGLISRYQGQIEDALRHYEKAISLWQRNQVARNNLNVLLGKPMENPSFIEKLFPPDRKAP